jgi:hypothetical protein
MKLHLGLLLQGVSRVLVDARWLWAPLADRISWQMYCLGRRLFQLGPRLTRRAGIIVDRRAKDKPRCF